MFNFKEMPQSASSLFAAYASFATSMMLIRSMTNDLLPPHLFSFVSSLFSYIFPARSSPQTTLVIENPPNFPKNQVYESAEIYLRTKINPSMDRLKVSQTPRQHKVTLSMERDQEIVDHFEGIPLKWRYVSVKKQNDSDAINGEEKRYYELVFDKKFLGRVVDFYFPYVLRRASEIKAMDNVAKLCSKNCAYDYYGDSDECRGNWRSISLEHPSTFDTLAMDPGLKKMIIDDLDRFVKRKEFYRKVGKAWKRGYLLYGPPGTGKSSLIAAMANYLKFDVYDLDLTDISSNYQLRESLLSTTNRSILVIEDIDCSVSLQNRENGDDEDLESSKSGLTLSGMLNFMDGLWSSCGDERIIILTTNHKDRLDPALLRPGRMDVHINLTYCTSKAFEVLATNYLGSGAIRHRLYGEIVELIDCANVTPAEVAEELMKGEDIDMVMEGLVKFVKVKREEQSGEKAAAAAELEGTEEDSKLETE